MKKFLLLIVIFLLQTSVCFANVGDEDDYYYNSTVEGRRFYNVIIYKYINVNSFANNDEFYKWESNIINTAIKTFTQHICIHIDSLTQVDMQEVTLDEVEILSSIMLSLVRPDYEYDPDTGLIKLILCINCDLELTDKYLQQAIDYHRNKKNNQFFTDMKDQKQIQIFERIYNISLLQDKKQTLSAYNELIGKEHVTSSMIYVKQGFLYKQLGLINKANRSFKTAIEVNSNKAAVAFAKAELGEDFITNYHYFLKNVERVFFKDEYDYVLNLLLGGN